MSTLRSYDAWRGSVRDFESWLGDVVPGAMDIDFLCEHNGNLLFLEGKPWAGGCYVPWGQYKTLLAICRLPGATVWLVGQDGDSVHVATIGQATAVWRQGRAWFGAAWFTEVSKSELRQQVAQWWAESEGVT